VAVLGGFITRTFFRAFFAPRLSLALAERLRGVALATVRFAGLFRAALEGLPALRRYRLSFSYCWSLLPLSHSRRLPFASV
jgi:hypothetical protein